ncbi:MAG TPA: hypothetical protein VEW94_11430 [Chloroflexia bacterium]|nr:hypothetical protein [Chloroflexia bacterium]
MMDNPPTRTVEDNVLVSTNMPAIKLKVDDRMEYVGRLQFVLYNVAEADIFVFAEGDEGRRLKRWLVVQFEGFLDNNSHTYNYAMPTRITLGSHEYMVDDYAANMETMMAEEPADSDGAQVAALLRREGYTLPDDAIWSRFVRTIGEARRKELLIIYTEDLAPLGLTASDLPANVPLPQEYAALTEGMHKRAQRAFTILEG